MNLPALEPIKDCIQPFADSRFTSVYLLSATDQANDNRPITMAISAGNQELRFRLSEAGPVLLSRHEVGCLFQCPCTLGLIKQDHMLWRCSFICKAVITEVMHVLNKGGDLLACFTLPHRHALNRSARDCISCQGLSKDSNQRAVARKKDAVSCTLLVQMPIRDVEPHKRFARARYACYKANDLLTGIACVLNNLVNCFRCSSKVLRAGITSRDRFHRMACIQRARRFDDRRCWQIAAHFPV